MRSDSDGYAAPQEIYNTIAAHTSTTQDEDSDRELLRQNLTQATETFLGNKILITCFKRAGLDLVRILKEEETKNFLKYTK